MTFPDLDSLRGPWAEQSRRIDDSLVLDVDAVRASLNRRTASAFARHRRWLGAAVLASAGCLLALLAFMAAHWPQSDWLATAAALLPLLLAELVIDAREWRALRQLDLDAPVLPLRELLQRLRWRRLRLAKGYMLLSVLLWWPFVLVLFKGLFGVDLLHWLPPSVLLANLAVGLAFIPVALAIAGAAAWQFGKTPGWQRFLDDVAGRSWRRAKDEFEARDSFEQALADGSAADVMRANFIPADVRAALPALWRRLLIGIVACAALILLCGAFNATHGGEVRYLLPGLLLLWTAVAHMVAQILHRIAVSDAAGDPSALRERLAAMLVMRRRVAALTLVLAPVLALALAIVLAKVGLGFDLVRAVALSAWLLIGALAVAASASLGRRWRGDAAAFLPRVVDGLCLGQLAPTRMLLERLRGEDLK